MLVALFCSCIFQPLTLDEMHLHEGGNGGSLTLAGFEPEFMRAVPPMLPIADSEVRRRRAVAVERWRGGEGLPLFAQKLIPWHDLAAEVSIACGALEEFLCSCQMGHRMVRSI